MDYFEILFWLMFILYTINEVYNFRVSKKEKERLEKTISFQERKIAGLLREVKFQKDKIQFLESIRRYPKGNYN